ncbi:MAG TPA: hypothetical protein VK142_09720 [Bacillota bacterium]|nr:hypothetical protein [Bacillota bacterium]
MCEMELKEIQQLKIKVEQHEETITQLLEIIATTNRRVSNLYDCHFKETGSSIPASMFSPK